MPERARAVVLASTGTGDIIPNATVTVREPGTANNIAETIYVADDPDASQYTNGAFFTSATGLVTFYLTDQKRVDVLFTKTGYTSVTIPVDVQKSALVASGITVSENGTPLDTDITTLDFLGADFDLTESPENEVNVVISAAIARDAEVAAAYQALSDYDAFRGAKVYRATAQSIPDATVTPINFTAEVFDSHALHDNATNNTRVLLNKVGKWLVTGQAVYVAGGTVGTRQVRLLLNGVMVAFGQVPDTNVFMGVQVSDIVNSAATTDYVELAANQVSGGALNVNPDAESTRLAVTYLGP